jgi:hypothetical protein
LPYFLHELSFNLRPVGAGLHYSTKNHPILSSSFLIMKKSIFITITLLLVSIFAQAQWTTTGSLTTINNTVGIGTTAPSYPFHLYNTTARSTNSGGSVDFGLDSYNNNLVGSRLYFGRSRGTLAAPLVVQNGDYLSLLDFYGHDGTTAQRAGQLIFKVDGTPASGIVPGAFLFTTVGSDGVNAERMRISSGGNVGVAAPAPISTFQVNSGPYKFSAGGCPGGDLHYGTAYIGFNAARIGRGNSANWTIEGDGSHNGGGVIYSDVAGTLYLAPIPSVGTTTRTLTDIDIKNNITFRVDANGITYAKAIAVQTTGWPDYVFEKNYTLPSLTDLKIYIDQNQHLPEIPSAQQIEKDGVNLGEMNKLLLKKVEELTLYLIEKDKQDTEKNKLLQALQARVSELEKNNSK